ncbi:hypothetical protein GOP47_0020035, partial [Adiantum capillus-veneris]
EWLGSLLKTYNSCAPLARATRFCGSLAATENRDLKVFASHCFYKGKAALSFCPGHPTFKVAEDGRIMLMKQGSMFLEFAPSSGVRQYDWTQKQVMALSVDEMGSLVALTSSESIEFFHDPHLLSSNAGKVRKSLKVEPMSDRSGFFFNFDMANKQDNVSLHLTVPVTKGEFTVMRSSFSYTIPYLMGWHSLINPSSAQHVRSSQANADAEWTK